MGFSFYPSLPTDKDKVRFYIGDIEPNQKQVDDETIEAILTLAGDSVFSASAMICEHLAAKYAKIKSRRGGVSAFDYRATASEYLKLSKKYRAKATLESGGTGILMPSMSKSTKQSNRSASDLTQAIFSRDLFDNPLVSSTNQNEDS